MAILRWRHGMTAAQARQVMEEQLAEAGYSDEVKWKGDQFSASVGWGTVLGIEGQITDEEAVLEKCGGAAGNTALKTIREILQQHRRLAVAGGHGSLGRSGETRWHSRHSMTSRGRWRR